MKKNWIGLIAALMGMAAPLAGHAQGAVEKALGGPAITCTGAIAWTEEGDGSTPRVEVLRLAARDAADASEIALFLSAADFVEGDIWSCTGGLCTSSGTLPTSATMNVMRLQPQVELASGEAVYGMQAVFVVVGAGGDTLQVERATGTGGFTCQKALPAGVVQAPN